jgi:hypothetical protein
LYGSDAEITVQTGAVPEIKAVWFDQAISSNIYSVLYWRVILNGVDLDLSVAVSACVYLFKDWTLACC